MEVLNHIVNVDIVSAFVDERDGGNAAGVVLDANGLSEAQMQKIAAQVNLSETAFVRAVDGGFRVDFFTPAKRVPDCGHATVAAFGLLAQQGLVRSETTKFTVNGPRAIRIDGDAVFMQQLPAAYEFIADYASVLAGLGMDESELVTLPTVARHDVGFIIVALASAGALSRLSPAMDEIAAICDVNGAIGMYVTAPGAREFDKTARMFAPGYGIPEESATGMAAGLLAAYLYDCAGICRDEYCFEQGAYMAPPSPSRLTAQLVTTKDKIDRVWVGGRAKLRERREIHTS